MLISPIPMWLGAGAGTVRYPIITLTAADVDNGDGYGFVLPGSPYEADSGLASGGSITGTLLNDYTTEGAVWRSYGLEGFFDVAFTGDITAVPEVIAITAILINDVSYPLFFKGLNTTVDGDYTIISFVRASPMTTGTYTLRFVA